MIRKSMIRRVKEEEFMRKFIEIIELKSFSIFINNDEEGHINIYKLDYKRD